jgi:hypothetical protein
VRDGTAGRDRRIRASSPASIPPLIVFAIFVSG